jgi:ABC-type Fe3+ transport system permease subunit/DNA-binding beta-propeller fold protein YncE
MNWPLLLNSLLVSGFATLLSMALGFFAALFLGGLAGRWRYLLLALAAIALAMPPFLVVNCWLHYLGFAGVWRGWLPFNIFSLGGTVWILALLTWPISFFATASSWNQLESAQLESDPAVTGWSLVRGLLFPVARSGLALAAVLTFVLALNNFAVPAILQVKVFPAEMWVRFNTTFDTLGALQLSWPLLIGPALLLLWFRNRELSWPRLEGAVVAKQFRRQLGTVWFVGSGLCTAMVCLLAAGLPVVQLTTAQRTWTELPGALAAGRPAIWTSAWVSIAAASLIMLLALAFGAWTANQNARRQPGFLLPILQVLAAALWIPFLLPGVLLGMGLIFVFNRPGLSWFYQSAGIVILAFGIRYLALGWGAVALSLRATDRDLTDAARLAGANRWQMFRYVHWPQVAPRVGATWYVVFLLCLWDVESMILVVPPGGETLALRVFNLLHYGHNAQVNALCFTLLCVAVAPLALWLLASWSRGLLSFARTRSVIACLACIGGLALLTGCGPASNSESASLSSRLFSRVQVIGKRGVGVGELNKPRSVAVDNQDNVYAVDMTGRVQKFSPEGTFVLSWQMPQTDKGKPKGMCRDNLGNIVVVEPHYQRVNYFSTEGKLLAQWGDRGTNAGQFLLPRAAGVNSLGEVIVSEYEGVERVQRFAPRGEKLMNGWGQLGSGPGEFNRPEGLCVDSQDRIYVADSCNHRIQIFTREGKFLRAYGHAGTGRGELSYPYDIAVDKAGRQYVCEFGNSRIQVFDAQDQPLEIIGGPGAEPGKFSNPWGVALDSVGNLYVADSQNHRVQKLVRRKDVAIEKHQSFAEKHQAPNTKHQKNTNIQTSNAKSSAEGVIGVSTFGALGPFVNGGFRGVPNARHDALSCLMFGAFLVFGVWCLVFPRPLVFAVLTT